MTVKLLAEKFIEFLRTREGHFFRRGLVDTSDKTDVDRIEFDGSFDRDELRHYLRQMMNELPFVTVGKKHT